MKTFLAVLIVILLATFSAGQTAVGGVTVAVTPGPPPPPQPQITNGPPPAGTQGSAYSFQFTACCGTPAYTWSSTGTLPDGTTLDSGTGVLSGTLGTPGTYNFNITVTDSLLQTAGAPYTVIIAPATPPTITNGPPPGGTVGFPYSFTFTAVGANPPFVFSLLSGSFPTGLTLGSNILSGVPTTAGTYTFRVRVTDSLAVTADSPTYTVVILPPVPVITNSIPPGGTTGQPYSFPFTATGGTAPYTWSISGTIPPVLGLNPSTGVLSGTLGSPGTYIFTITVTDSLLQQASAQYSITILALQTGTTPTLPQAWVNNHECDGTTANTINFPADGLGMHGGTPYASTQVGFQQALTDANTKRDADGSGTKIVMPISTFSGTSGMVLPGSNTVTGKNSTNCIVVTSSVPATPNTTICSGGVRDSQRNPGCTNNTANLWTWSTTTTATQSVVSCNLPGTQGPPHHYQLLNGELRYDTAATSGNAVAVVWCGTGAETTEANQPNHIHLTQDYLHGYDSPIVSATSGVIYSAKQFSVTYSYMEQIHGQNAEGQGLGTFQSSQVKISDNWIEGGSEGLLIGGTPPAIAGYTPSDFEIRSNNFTRNYADFAKSSCVAHPQNWQIANRFELRNAQRVLVDGNLFSQSWCDKQTGFLMALNVRACGISGCTGGNNATVSDITITNNILHSAAQGISTDAASNGNNSGPGSGFGQSRKGRRWKIENNLVYDIGDFTRYPGTNSLTSFTSVILSVGSSGQTMTCSLTRNAGGTLATAVCTSQGNVPGTGLEVGDPVKLTACSPDTGFNVGAAQVGPPVITGAPSSLTFTFNNSGAANGSATCTLDNSVGSPEFLTYNHNSVFGASNAVTWLGTEFRSPTFQYPISNLFTNNLFASNGGNPGGWVATGKTEGNPTEQLWDTSTLQFNCNVFTGRNSNLYLLYQTGQCTNGFPGNLAGGANNQTGIVCSGGNPDSSCLGVASLMNGQAYNSNPSDYHRLSLMTASNWNTGNAGQASDGKQRGASIDDIDRAIDSTIYTCGTPCGNGPYPDATAVFMVPAGGDNVHNCTYTQPCGPATLGADSGAALTAAKTAVQLLPVGGRVSFLRNGLYRLTSTTNWSSGDSGLPQEDMVNWWMPSNKTSSHLTGTGNPVYSWLGADGGNSQIMWLIKAGTGNPWDIQPYDNTNVYYWITENTDTCLFTNPNCYKRQVIPIPVSPRFFTKGTTVTYLLTGPAGATNPSIRTTNCELDSPPTTFLGDVKGVTSGPTTIAWGGSVGTVPTIEFDFFYGGSGGNGIYPQRERRWLVFGVGRVQWDHANLSGGIYVVDQTVTSTTVSAGGSPAPNWTCGTAFPWWFGGTPGAGGNVATPGGGTAPTPAVLWRNFPGETAQITGLKQVPAPVNVGSCGANCQDWTVTLPAASWKNFEQLWYNGNRRKRPQYAGATPVHGYAPNACPAVADNPFLCVTAANITLADAACSCPAAVTGAGLHCAGTQSKECTMGPTKFQCFNHYMVNSGDVLSSWHGFNVGDPEMLLFETWTMPRMRALSVASGTNVSLTGATQTTNDHGCQNGHFYLVENVLPADVGVNPKGMWYLDHCPTNACKIWSSGTTYSIGQGVAYLGAFYTSLQNGNLNHQPDISPSFWQAGADPSVAYETNWTLHVYADITAGENPGTADIEVPQLDVNTNGSLMTATGLNSVTFQGLQMSGDNFYPDPSGLADSQGQPGVTSLFKLVTSSHITFDTMKVCQTAGGGLDFQSTSTNNLVQNSYFCDIGGLSIKFGTGTAGRVNAQDTDTELNVPQFNTVQNNLFDHPQRVQPTGYGPGVFSGDVHHTLVTHNEVGYGYTGGLELCFGLKRGADNGTTTQQFFCHDNEFSYNLIYGAPNALMTDFGGIYSAPSYSTNCPAGTPATGAPCNRFTNNYIHDMYNNYDMTGNAASSGARGIYCDQGCTNVLAQYNLIVRTGHSGFYWNQPQIAGPNHWLAQNNLADNNILAYCGYTNASFTVNLATGCLAKNGQNAGALTFSHNISYFNTPTAINHFQVIPAQWTCFGTFWVIYNGANSTATVQVSATQITLTDSSPHVINLTGQTLSQIVTSINALTGYLSGTTTDAGGIAATLLTNPVAATNIKGVQYADNSVNFFTQCSQHFTFSNNDYRNFLSPNTLQYGVCRTPQCAAPFNPANYFAYSGTGVIPAQWTNTWQPDGSALGMDAGSVSFDPVFTAPGYPTDDYHYSHNFAGQGITVFDYTLAGRLAGSPWSVNPNITEMFPVRPVNPMSDFQSVAPPANTFYIRVGASGANNGTDWTNAFNTWPTFVRGNTYYVAGGLYPFKNFNTPVSGTQVITIKHATVADHGTAVGWNDSFAAQTHLGGAGWGSGNGGIVGNEISTPFWVFDGNSGNGLNFVNSSAAYGFIVDKPNGGGNTCATAHHSYFWIADIGNITYRNIAIDACGPAFDVEQRCFDNGSGTPVTIQNNYANACQNSIMLFQNTGYLMEYNQLWNQWSSGAHHGESVNSFATSNHTFRYNYVNGCAGTGCIAANIGAPIGINNWDIYGNIFLNDTSGNGTITGVTEVISNTRVYNNTFVNCSTRWFKDGDGAPSSGNVLQNNLLYNSSADIQNLGGGSIVESFNSCFDCSGTPLGGSNDTNGSGNPFVNSAGNNFQLVTDTAAWFTLAAPYDVDMLGVTRTSSRGALQKQ